MKERNRRLEKKGTLAFLLMLTVLVLSGSGPRALAQESVHVYLPGDGVR